MIAAMLYRDIKSVVQFYRLWLGLAVALLMLGVLLLSIFEDYLTIQAQLQANDINRGIEDLVLLPYFRLAGYVGAIAMIIFASRLFYHEKFSPYALFYQSSGQRFGALFMAKISWVIVISLFLTLVVLIPVLSLRFFANFQAQIVIFGFCGLLFLFSLLGLFAVFLSKFFANSSVVCLVAFFVLLTLELLGKIIIEPIWLQSIIFYFSPFKHFNEIIEGKLFISSIIFYLSSIMYSFFVLARSFQNDRLHAH